MVTKNFDIIIIGAGSGGLNVAGFMNRAGFKVLLVDKSDENIGGDCLNFGCVPSKALIHAARMVKDARSAEQFGIKTSGLVDMKKVIGYIKDKQNYFRKHESAEYFRSIGMTVELGEAKFTGRRSVSINGKEYSAKKIVVATGGRPRKLKLPGIENTGQWNNENIFDIDFLPAKLLIVGGGPIGIEMAQAFRFLGSEVSVIQNSGRFLPKEDKEIAEALLNNLQRDGIKFYFNAVTKEIIDGSKLLVEINNKSRSIDFDTLFTAIGRELNTEGLDLQKAGIEMDGRKIKVDEYLRTSNKDVLLCGDIAGQYQFTHAAELHAGVIINNFFSPLKKKVNYDHLSWVTYTSPEVATFGLSESELKKRGVEYEVLRDDFKDDDRAIVDDYPESLIKLYIAKNKILGGTMAAPNAGELIQELILANSAGLKLKNIFSKIYPYPTASRVNKRVISQYFSGKLTPGIKKVMQFLFR